MLLNRPTSIVRSTCQGIVCTWLLDARVDLGIGAANER